MFDSLTTMMSRVIAATLLCSFTGPALAQVKSLATVPVTGHAPVALKPALIYLISDTDKNGLITAGDRLQIQWKITTEVSDPDGDTIKSARFEWFADGELISTHHTITIEEAYEGKRITANAYAQTDPNITEPFESLDGPAGIAPALGLSEIIVQPGTTLTHLSLSGLVDGYPNVGQTLTANVSCVSTCAELVYTWSIESAVGSNTYTVITGATGKTYTPLKGDQKRRIQIVVRNK
ncbi:ZirU family protein [Pseudomonas sp. TTU2014-080ASC]|uniref:ZirU family protein n=1 Tax=Pseudomonas sp. TTU2014-080ASC TaxID=1729724 RepID=UPI0007185B16|nr:ZirU family protein [Pseudomonas sp. TTU2014-080ASC]KRW57822.1 hypothetical protein AO726_19385 [Pseudomonas sp. TTU2014-080ASC]